MRLVIPTSAPPGAGPAASGHRRAFDAQEADLTVGVEEEVMLLDAASLALVPECERLLEQLAGDPRFSPELPAAQLELISPVCANADELLVPLLAARRDLLRVAAPGVRLAGAGTHPFASAEGAITPRSRYAQIAHEYQWAARRGLAWGLHVHVAIRGADRALAVHDAIREWLPLLAAIAGNAPFHEGADSGLASVRPKLAEGFPRQGVPPAWGSWAEYEAFLAWGAREQAFTQGQLWWEARLHPGFGTLEVRVCDQPATAAGSAALAAVVQGLCGLLADRFDAGMLPAPAPRERIEENRWRALRHGLDGTLLDLESGEARPARELACALLELLAPYADLLGSSRALGDAWQLVERTGAERQRDAAASAGGDLRPVVEMLAQAYEDEVAGLL